jgi:hypothetical protein
MGRWKRPGDSSTPKKKPITSKQRAWTARTYRDLGIGAFFLSLLILGDVAYDLRHGGVAKLSVNFTAMGICCFVAAIICGVIWYRHREKRRSDQ